MSENKTKNEAEEKNEIYDWLQCVVYALVACVLIFTFVARVITVYGRSMQDTFYEGHRVIISRLAAPYEYGDIVVLQKDSFGPAPIIKRVIAVEGQTVDIDFEQGIVYVDHVALAEPYTKEPTYEREDFSGPITVPEGHVFVMGDNRNHSEDSRRASIGCVSTEDVLGEVFLRIWPISQFGPVA